MTETNIKTHVYFKRSALILRVNTIIFLTSLISSILFSSFLNSETGIFAFLTFLIGLSGLSMMVLAPIGLYSSAKSNKRKEGTARQRFLHRIGHLFFCLLDVLIISVFVKDLIKLFSV